MHKKRKNKSINGLSLRLYDALFWVFIVFCFRAHRNWCALFFNYFYFFYTLIV